MERKRLVNRANAGHRFGWRGDCRLREHEGAASTRFTHRQGAGRFGLGVVAGLALMMASCADYEGDYEQSVQGYLSGQPKAAQPADGAAATTQTTTPAGGGSNGTISYGSGSSSEGSASGSGSGSPAGFQTIGSGASGVILPGQ